MSKGFTWAQAAKSAAHLAVLLLLGSGDLLAQQRLGRQQDLTTQQVDSLRSQIQQLDGRAIIGFKPVDAEQGMLPEGTPALVQSTVRLLAESLSPMGVVVLRQFRLIPAVAVRMDPDRIEELLASFNIDYVEPDVLHVPTGVPEIPDLDAIVVQENPWGIDRVNAPAAWAITKGAGAKLGIIDTGIDEDHPDLNVIGGINLVTGGTLRSDWDDNSAICITHGTHVAGSAAALDNDILVVGVAPEAELYALRVFDPEGGGEIGCSASTSDIIAALDWAVANGLDVVNLSLGSSLPSISGADAVRAAFSAGLVVVASAGNSGASVGFPGGYPDVIAVAAMDEADLVASFSSRGPEVDIAAPGVNVLSTWGGGGTEFLAGTSMASPHVAGVATLIRAASPGLSATDVREILRNTADDIAPTGYDNLAGYGVVDAEAAANAVGTSLFALATVPGLLMLAAEPGGAAATEAVEIRNVGAAGTISWTASGSETWLGLSATSGTATTETPATLDVTADPTGLDPGIYTGFVVVEGNAANSPAQVRVRLAVAPRIALDATVATRGEIPVGGRARYLFSGTAGQLIDVAVLADLSHAQPLTRVDLRIFKTDNPERILTSVLGAPFNSGLGTQGLLVSYPLPEDGDYLIEVRSIFDRTGGGFILKAREAGPIIAVSSISHIRAEEGTTEPQSITMDVFNLSGIGSLGFTVSVNEPWLSTDPTSGIAAEGVLVALEEPSPGRLTAGGHGLVDIAPDVLDDEDQSGRVTLGLPDAPDRFPMEGVQNVTITVSADPTGIAAGDVLGLISIHPEDGWLPPADVEVNLRVYSPGMVILADGHSSPWGLTSDTPHRAMGADFDLNTTLHPITADAVGEAFATNVGIFSGGLTKGGDDSFYMVEGFGTAIVRILPDGTSEPFATSPIGLRYIANGPDGEFYVSGCNAGLYRMSADGTVIEPFGPFISCPYGIVYDPTENVLYVNSLFNNQIHRVGLNGSDLGVIGDGAGFIRPTDIAVGRSGLLYIVEEIAGRVWTVDPSDGRAQSLGTTPGNRVRGLALVEGAVLMSDIGHSEFYSFPVNDGPLGTGGAPTLITVRLVPDDIVNLAGLAKTIPGEGFRIPLNIDISPSSTAVANYTMALNWDPSRLDFLNLAQGDFTTGSGSFVANTSGAADGSLVVTGAEPDGRGAGGTNFTLFTLDLVVDESLGVGQGVTVSIDVTEVGGALNEDLFPVVGVVAEQICLSLNPMGDVTLNGQASAGDATQILRHIVGLPPAPNIDLDRGDVTGDGNVGVGDVVDILRNLVGLPIPASSRVDKPPLESCS